MKKLLNMFIGFIILSIAVVVGSYYLFYKNVPAQKASENLINQNLSKAEEDVPAPVMLDNYVRRTTNDLLLAPCYHTVKGRDSKKLLESIHVFTPEQAKTISTCVLEKTVGITYFTPYMRLVLAKTILVDAQNEFLNKNYSVVNGLTYKARKFLMEDHKPYYNYLIALDGFCSRGENGEVCKHLSGEIKEDLMQYRIEEPRLNLMFKGLTWEALNVDDAIRFKHMSESSKAIQDHYYFEYLSLFNK